MPDLDELYGKVSDIYEREEFEELIEEKKGELGDFYNDGVVAKLIVAEEGRNDEMVSNISDVEQDDGATLEGRIVDLGELRTFDTDGEGEGKVRNVTIDDGTGTIKVVLWGDDAERAGRNYALQDVLRVINGYVQDKGYGLEISKGKYGEIEHISKEIADEREDIHC